MMRIKMKGLGTTEQAEVNSSRQLAVRVLSSADDMQKRALSDWAEGLLMIRNSNNSVIKKGREAIQFTGKSKILIPIFKIIAKEIKIDQFDASKLNLESKRSISRSVKSFWNNRSFPMKIGIGAFSASLIVFGTQGAGIAAFGTAIGVPLWIVLGTGATFAAVLYEEVTGQKFEPKEIRLERRKSNFKKVKNIVAKLRRNKESK
jgi:hypothetical protein